MTTGVLAEALLAAADVGSGKITGGWGYVWASWGITWGIIAAYALFLWSRRESAQGDERNEP